MRKLNLILLTVIAPVVGLAAAASASPLVYVDVLGSTTQGGTYTNSLSAPEGSTIYYELTLASASPGATNAHTTATPNGTSDSGNTVPVFTITDASGDFTSATEQAPWSGGTGANTTIGQSGTVLSVRAITSGGAYVNDDTPQTLVTGQFTVSSSGNPETLAGAYSSSSGAFKVGGTTVIDSSSDETGSDPIVGYTNLTITPATPEPASLGLLGLGGLALMRRRRTSRTAASKA
jgi:hypothetical protein